MGSALADPGRLLALLADCSVVVAQHCCSLDLSVHSRIIHFKLLRGQPISEVESLKRRNLIQTAIYACTDPDKILVYRDRLVAAILR